MENKTETKIMAEIDGFSSLIVSSSYISKAAVFSGSCLQIVYFREGK
jgi:hypothetical protein